MGKERAAGSQPAMAVISPSRAESAKHNKVFARIGSRRAIIRYPKDMYKFDGTQRKSLEKQ